MNEEEVKKIVEGYLKEHLNIRISSDEYNSRAYVTVMLYLDDSEISSYNVTMYLDANDSDY
jgi:hypothetical protein